MSYDAGDISSDNESIEEIAMEHDSMQNNEEIDYELLNERQVMEELNSVVADTSSVIGLLPGVCKILLHHFHWDKERLVEKYYETSDINRFLDSCHILDTRMEKNAEIQQISTCQICFEELQLTGLSCAHLYCANCWKNYLNVKIHDECLWLIPCPGPKCSRILEEETINRLIESKEVLKEYQKHVLKSFILSSSTLKYCPGLDCTYVAKVSYSECRPIKCKCRTIFCFACGQEWHEPVDCEMLKKWLKKCSDDSETSNWLNANTKDCPQCHTTIEKDGGCNHVTCKSASCRFEFCWTCLGPWKPHGSGWYSCNRFDDTDAKKARDEQERSRAALQRYLHYYNRFTNHRNSLKLEKKLHSQVEEKMKQMQQQEFSWIETQYLKKAVDVLNECRRTLMYTYAFAFYLEKSNQTTIFENNQRDLELATEHLSELLEKDLDMEKDQLKTWKQNVQDKYRYVSNRMVILLEHVSEGNTKNEWAFNNKL